MVQFSTPMGIAFLEDTSAHSQVLLIADSGNHRIRALDTATGITTTWFEPKVWFLLLTLKSTKGYLKLFHPRVLGCIASARSASATLLLPLIEL